MALNLKNPRTLHAIDELARLTGESKSEAVASAIEARLAALVAADEAANVPEGPPEIACARSLPTQPRDSPAQALGQTARGVTSTPPPSSTTPPASPDDRRHVRCHRHPAR